MNKLKTICENNKILKVCCKILGLKYAKIIIAVLVVGLVGLVVWCYGFPDIIKSIIIDFSKGSVVTLVHFFR